MKLIKGKKYKAIYLQSILLKDLWAVFFPSNFYEKYRYLGRPPINVEGDLFKALYPLVLAMDYAAKPKWCPRWFLRLLHLFGNDNSIVRVRNRKLHDLHRKLTKGIMLVDWKTKWSDYDLRISIHGPEYLWNLGEDISKGFYIRGKKKEDGIHNVQE